MFLLVPRGQNAVLSVLCSLLVTLNQRSSLPLFLFPCCELKKCHDFLIEVTLVVTKQAGFEKNRALQFWSRAGSRGAALGGAELDQKGLLGCSQERQGGFFFLFLFPNFLLF